MTRRQRKERSARDFMPKRLTLPAMRRAAAKCHGCHLYRNAIQTVFGEGSDHAKLMIVGEIPGKVEDERGEPFTGPAGVFLRKSLTSLGLDEEDIYFTNVVKHFKFAYINKRKLHRTPIGKEIKACMPWLEAEIKVVQPKVIVCLGATAAKSIVAKNFRIHAQRGKWLRFAENMQVLVTFHPSAILRAPDRAARHKMKRLFLNDIKKVAIFLSKI